MKVGEYKLKDQAIIPRRASCPNYFGQKHRRQDRFQIGSHYHFAEANDAPGV